MELGDMQLQVWDLLFLAASGESRTILEHCVGSQWIDMLRRLNGTRERMSLTSRRTLRDKVTYRTR